MADTVKCLFNEKEFIPYVSTPAAGMGLALIIPLAIAAVVAHRYSPEQFGVLALLIAAAPSLSLLATGRYEVANMFPHKDVDAAGKPSSQAPRVWAPGRSPSSQRLERVK